MKKNKGFTLVELLAVITIIGVLALITIPTVDSIIKSSKEDAYEDQKGLIISAAKNWAADNALSLPTEDGEEVTVTLGELKKGGFIGKDVKNPVNDQCISNSTVIVITRTNNNYTYEFEDEDNIKFSGTTCEA